MNSINSVDNKRVTTLPRTVAAAAAFLLALALGACGGQSGAAGESGGDGSSKLTLVAYSTPREAYAQILPDFAKTPAGQGVTFNQSYGSSGEQARAVEGGLKADVVALSLAPDVDKLVKAGLVESNWSRARNAGMVTNSVVVFAVRKGNPKNIRTWADLVKPGVEVITPNPFTSGGAKWNLMAAYQAQIVQGRSPQQGLDYLERMLRNTPVQDKSARESLQTFSGGKGDVLLAYENEAITARAKGEELDYVIPDQTILIENPAAVVKGSANQEKAKAFVDFLHTPVAQRVFASKGYRPVDASLLDAKRFPKPKQLFTIRDIGGWSKVNQEFFDPSTGSVAKIERSLGVSTAK
jgi:sulfate transport system substrate-binding protein